MTNGLGKHATSSTENPRERPPALPSQSTSRDAEPIKEEQATEPAPSSRD
jgi:hypothetical protein